MGQAVYIGIGGTVLALDRTTGQEVWRNKLKMSDFVSVVLRDGDLYATAAGEIYCLDPATGVVRWHNQLKGLGRGLVTIATAEGGQVATMREKRQRDAAAAASASG
jgi:outer membrane protein assembly factor BamB